MNYFTATIPPTLAEKLKEKGMKLKCFYGLPMYADVFDWLMEKGIFIKPDITDKDDGTLGYVAEVIFIWKSSLFLGVFSTWHEAAEASIEKALELI